MAKIMIIAPHPDDETLGCGGTILKHRSFGDEIYWLIVTNISIELGYEEDRVRKRQDEINIVASRYEFQKVFKMNYPTTRLDTIPLNDIISKIINIVTEVEPEIVYLPNKNDVHSDHKITFDALISSTKTFRNPFIRRILMYETISETEFSPSCSCNAFVPNFFSDITAYMGEKLSIVKIYGSEMAKHPFPRSKENIKALATFRGATAGVKYAEAFVILKEIW